MQTSTQSLPKSTIKITVTLTQEETEKHLDKAAKEISHMVKVPGFRPGTAPVDILRTHIKDGAIESHMLDMALPETYSKAIEQEKIQPVSRPHIKIISDVPLTYEATVAVYPEVKISGYEKIKVPKEEAKVEDKDVEAVLADIQKRHATYVPVDRAAQKGDRVEIDFEGFDDAGVPLENTQSKHHPVVLGDGNFVPGFEENLMGLKGAPAGAPEDSSGGAPENSKESSKEFTVTFPKEYFHKPFQNKKVTFKVKVHAVEEVKLPEFTPDFIKTVAGGQEKTLDELKTLIRQNLEQEKEYAAKTKRENAFLDSIADLTKTDLPEPLIEEEIDSMIEEFKGELERKGMDLQLYLEQAKKEMKDLRDMRKKEAEKRITLRFGLQQLFKQENMDATEEELKKEVDHLMTLYPETEHAKLKKEYEEGSYLRTRLINKIKMDKLFEKYLK